MTGPTPSFPPPRDAEARYDAVLRRGAALRRRRRLARGAGAGGAALVVLLVAVLVLGDGSGSDTQVVDSPTTSTSTTTSTTTPPAEMTVRATASAGTVTVAVDDPAMPSTAGSQQCAYVRLAPEGPATVAAAEVRACWTPAEGTADTEAALVATNGAEVGCGPATAERSDDTAPPTTSPRTRVRHRFRFTVPGGLAPGSYVAEVSVASGVGDGCAPATDTEQETVGTAKAQLDIP